MLITVPALSVISLFNNLDDLLQTDCISSIEYAPRMIEEGVLSELRKGGEAHAAEEAAPGPLRSTRSREAGGGAGRCPR